MHVQALRTIPTDNREGSKPPNSNGASERTKLVQRPFLTAKSATVGFCNKDRIEQLSEGDLALAKWRQEVIRPILVLEKGSPARAELIEELAQKPRLFPNGNRKKVAKSALYNWVRDFEAEGLNGLIRKRRADSGAKRQKVTRAWDAFFEAHIDAAKHAEISDELTTYTGGA